MLMLIYNIARLLPYLIPIGVIISWYISHIRTAVRPNRMACENQANSDFRPLAFTNFIQKWTEIVKNYPTFLLELSLLVVNVNIVMNRNP